MTNMFVIFGEGKCPLCGDGGSRLGRQTYHCRRCDIAFNDFAISSLREPQESEVKFWT
ncbi:MAG: hypothetical protein HY368_01120 [Candidatus Aenigmarchaeota archaeon]|nr:hypothetical protein [Candidatus Aenigmarchaeota archaeon]